VRGTLLKALGPIEVREGGAPVPSSKDREETFVPSKAYPPIVTSVVGRLRLPAIGLFWKALSSIRDRVDPASNISVSSLVNMNALSPIVMTVDGIESTPSNGILENAY
jgi:hypothetical protein